LTSIAENATTGADLNPEKLKALLSSERRLVQETLGRRGLDIQDFDRPSAWHCLRYFFTIWLSGAAAIALWFTGSPVYMIFSVIMMAWVQTAAVLIVHEASHRNLLSGKRVNELVGNLLFALPVGLTVDSYRATHVLHHNYLNTERDPSGFVTRVGLSRADVCKQWLFLLSGRVIFDLVVRTFSGKRLEKTVVTPDRDQRVASAERRRAMYVFLYHAPIIATSYYYGVIDAWVVWVVSTVTLVPFLDGLRVTIEHRPGPGAPADFHTRSHHRWTVASALVSPFFQYHWEHHVCPSIPHYQLARMHAILVEEGVDKALPVRGGPFGGFFQAMAKESAG